MWLKIGLFVVVGVLSYLVLQFGLGLSWERSVVFATLIGWMPPFVMASMTPPEERAD